MGSRAYHSVGGNMDSERPAVRSLRDYLSTIAPGPVPASADVVTLLATCWGEFRGGGVEGMVASKLHGRVERLT